MVQLSSLFWYFRPQSDCARHICYTIFESICNYATPFYSDGHNNCGYTRIVDPLIGDIDDWEISQFII